MIQKFFPFPVFGRRPPSHLPDVRGRRLDDMRILLFIVSLWCVVTVTTTPFSSADDAWFTHVIAIDDNGVATVNAQLTLPVPPTTTYAVLTDYPRWPDLFPKKPLIESIRRIDNRTRITMHVPADYLPVTLKLITDTIEVDPLRLTATLVSGDFDRYHWTWDLNQSPSEKLTTAQLFLQVAPAAWVPNWIFRWLLESELTKHFQLLREQVLARHQASAHVPRLPPPN